MLLLGYDNLGPLYFRGTWFVNEDYCHGYVGFVFGYQTSSKFYVVMWKHEHTNWYDTEYRAGIKGIQLKVRTSVVTCSNRMLYGFHPLAANIDTAT